MTFVSKNVYIDKLDDKVNEYNNTYHRTIKLQPADVYTYLYLYIFRHILIPVKNVMKNILNFKLINFTLEYQNTKTFLLKNILQIGL